MKKVIAILLALMLCVTVFAACGSDPEPPPRDRDRDRDRSIDTPSESSRPDPSPARNEAPSGYYTIVELEEDGEDVLAFYRDWGINTDDIFIEFLRGGNLRMGFLPDYEDEIGEGTFTVDGSRITIRIDGEEVSGTIDGNRVTLNIEGMEMVFERNNRYTGPVFDTPGPGPGGTNRGGIPGNGGSVQVSGVTEYSFTPNYSGMWEFRTSNNGTSDPFLELYDSSGRMIDSNDDGAGDYNALITANLQAGQTYTINARFWGSTTAGSYTLTVTDVDSGPIAIEGYTNIRVDGVTEFMFTPTIDGWWEFRTYDNGSSDPYLEIFDMSGRQIGYDDDSGDGYNALLEIDLDAWATYIVLARFWGSTTGGSYMLEISLQNSVGVIPASGGTVWVNDYTEFAFTPDRSGTWEFRTHDNGRADPMLELYDYRMNLIADDDDGGDGWNSLITMNLEAGHTYTVVAKFWSQSQDGYNLTVTRR